MDYLHANAIVAKHQGTSIVFVLRGPWCYLILASPAHKQPNKFKQPQQLKLLNQLIEVLKLAQTAQTTVVSYQNEKFSFKRELPTCPHHCRFFVGERDKIGNSHLIEALSFEKDKGSHILGNTSTFLNFQSFTGLLVPPNLPTQSNLFWRKPQIV